MGLNSFLQKFYIFLSIITIGINSYTGTISPLSTTLGTIDKIAGSALILMPLIYQHIKTNSLIKISDKLNDAEEESIQKMLYEVCSQLKVSPNINVRKSKKIDSESIASAHPTLFGKNKIIVSYDFFKLPPDQPKSSTWA